MLLLMAAVLIPTLKSRGRKATGSSNSANSLEPAHVSYQLDELSNQTVIATGMTDENSSKFNETSDLNASYPEGSQHIDSKVDPASLSDYQNSKQNQPR